MSKTQILIIEDDAEISRLTSMYLQVEGFDTHIVDDGNLAIDAIKDYKPDLVLLDLMLPGLDGAKICQQARDFFHGPIMILTACADDMSEVSLLKLGADDYLTKPIKPHIMVARIEALLRRATQQHNYTNPKNTAATERKSNSLVIGQLAIKPRKQQAYFAGVQLELTEAEYEMLVLLAHQAGNTVTREACCQSLRGIDYDYNDRSVDMRISGLRKKIGDDKPPYKVILTIRNKGYMLTHD